MDDVLTAVMLKQSTIAELRRALAVDTTRETELREEVLLWRTELAAASAARDEVAATDEHDKMFHHPAVGGFSPWNKYNKTRMLSELQGPIETATGRLAFAEFALQQYLTGLSK